MIRRAFLKISGCLTIGFALGRPLVSGSPGTGIAEELPQSLQRNPAINAWLQINSEGRLQIFTGKMELGQGIKTAIAQVAAEELDMNMSQVDVHLAETNVTPDEGYTAGSGSIDNSAMSVRYAAAAARNKLITLASAALHVPPGDLTMMAGVISTRDKRKQISFTELLAGKQITDRVSLPVSLKAKKNHRLVGKAIPRDDIRLMITGKPVFLQDLRFPGMLHARIIRPPAYTSRLLSFDNAALKKQFPSVINIVVDGSFIGVITEDEYAAVQVQTVGENFGKWTTPESLITDLTVPLKKYLQTLPVKSENVKKTGTVNLDAPQQGFAHSASYYKPYMMHGSIGPSCAIALYNDGKLQVWSHSQGVYPLRVTLHKLLDVPLENIHITGVPGSGCYGHNGADDVSAEAAILAMAQPGRHIRLQWSRADEHAWEPYGSAMIMEVKAKVSAAGKITDWQYNLWSDTHGTRPGGNPENLLPAGYIRKSFPGKPGGYSGGTYRNADPYYDIPNQQIDVHFFDGPLRVSALRSLGAYGNVFAIECFMDELADKAGRDPFEFRLTHLTDERALAVIIKLKELTKGFQPQPDVNLQVTRHGLGIAFSRYKNTAAYCATAAHVSYIESRKEIIINKMFSVIDAGEVINIDGLINQTEGGMIQAASWTMQEEVKFNERRLLSQDWKSYPIFRFSQAPETMVILIDNPQDGPMGAGEAAQGPAGAAVANAVYRATGVRYRDLPIAGAPLPVS